MTQWETESAAWMVSAQGESVTVITPSGASRAVTAVVDREPPMRLRMIPGLQAVRVLVTFRNDSTHGISTAESNLTGFAVSLPVRVGATAERLQCCSKGNPVSQDAGAVTLAFQ